MNEFTIQFDQSDFEIQFQSDGNELPFNVNQICTVDNKLLLELEQTNGVLLESIKSKLAEIFGFLESSQDEICVTTHRFAESFTKLVFSKDPELVQEKVKAHLDQALSTLDSTQPIYIWVNPKQLQTIKEYLQGSGIKELEVNSDPLLGESDCRVQGPEEGWITRIENQLELCRQKFNQKTGENERNS